MELPEAYGKFIFGSFKEWLFLADCEKSCLDISLLNPFSGENITLPSTSPDVFLTVLSAAPNDDNCICLMVREAGIAFWTPGSSQWHQVSLFLNLLDATFYGERFYLLYKHGRIVVIDEKDIIIMLNNENGASFPYQTLSVKLPDHLKSHRARHYLVESCEKIILVSRFFFINDAYIYETCAFEMYKLDLHKMAWLKLENLENQILFVGSCCSRSFLPTDLGDAFAQKVYFINGTYCVCFNEWDIFNKLIDNYANSDGWGVFCTQTPNHWPSIFRARANLWSGVWLTAPISWCLKQRRR